MPADSTGVEAPSPLPRKEISSSAHKPSLFQKLRIRNSAPIAFETQAHYRSKHRRSSSLGELISRILPTHREERGYTLRKQYDQSSTQDPVELIFGASCVLPGHVESCGHVNRAKTNQSKSEGLSNGRRHSGWTVLGSRPVGVDGASRVRYDRLYPTSLGRGFGLERNARGLVYLVEPDNEQAGKAILLSAERQRLPSKTQEIFENRKVRREQRRSLRESGDFLGVQGANPRTGFWDVSSGTGSTDPSLMSEETKNKLYQEAKDIEEQKERYENAIAKHRAELVRIQTLRDNKMTEKEKRKTNELKMKQRRHGKWKLSEDGWHSLAEPELSPVIQSVAGSPGKDTAPGDRLFPMPTADDPTPYVDPSNIGPQDYFGHRLVSSPLAKERLSASASPLESVRHSTPIPRKPVASRTHRNDEDGSTSSVQRKTVGSPSRRKVEGGIHTIVHAAHETAGSFREVVPRKIKSEEVLYQSSPAERSLRGVHELTASSRRMSGFGSETPSATVPMEAQSCNRSFAESIQAPRKFESFLDHNLDPWSGELLRKEATVTSFQSASTFRVVSLPQLDQSQKATSPEKSHNFLKELPSVTLKDPFTTRIPWNSQPIVSTIWAPPPFLSSSRRLTHPIITIPTTITTGTTRFQLSHPHFDQQKDQEDGIRGRQLSLQRKSSLIPPRGASLPNSKHPGLQDDLGAIAISSGHLLRPTKQRTAESCHTTSPGGGKVGVKSTPIFISTFQSRHEMICPAARIAFLGPFQKLRHRAAMKKAETQNTVGSLAPPNLRRTTAGVENISPRPRMLQDEHAGTGVRLESRLHEHDRHQNIANVPNMIPGRTVGWEDSLVVFNPCPDADNGRSPSSLVAPSSLGFCPQNVPSTSPSQSRTLKQDEKGGLLRRGNISLSIMTGGGSRRGARHKQVHGIVTRAGKRKEALSHKQAPPRSRRMQNIEAVILRMIQLAWCFVEPVFDPKSDIRRRWDAGEGHLIFRDIILLIAATGAVVGALLIIVLGLRALIMGLQIAGGLWNICRFITGV